MSTVLLAPPPPAAELRSHQLGIDGKSLITSQEVEIEGRLALTCMRKPSAFFPMEKLFPVCNVT
jgi:hypothetical protein